MISSLLKVRLLCFPNRPFPTCLHSPSPVCLSNHLPCHTGLILTPLYPRDKGGMLLQNAAIRVQDCKVSFTIHNTITININTLIYWTYQKKSENFRIWGKLFPYWVQWCNSQHDILLIRTASHPGAFIRLSYASTHTERLTGE